jgi:hypothetical protein
MGERVVDGRLVGDAEEGRGETHVNPIVLKVRSIIRRVSEAPLMEDCP